MSDLSGALKVLIYCVSVLVLAPVVITTAIIIWMVLSETICAKKERKKVS